MSCSNIQTCFSNFLSSLALLEEEVQVITAEKTSKTVEVETLQGVLNSLANQVSYRKLKMKTEEETMKRTWVETEEEKLESSIEGRLDKEKKLAVIESARLEQTMLREAVRNLKIEKIRLVKKLEAVVEKKNVAEVAKKCVLELEDVRNKLATAEQMDEKLGEELEEMINVATEYQEKLDIIVKEIEISVEKKAHVEKVLRSKKYEDLDVSDVGVEVKDVDVSQLVNMKTDEKLSDVKSKIICVEKEIEEKSSTLEELLSTIGSFVEADKKKMSFKEERKKRVEELQEKIDTEKKKVEIEREEFLAKIEEERNSLAKRELTLNISLAGINMDIEREKSMNLRNRNKFGGDGKLERNDIATETMKDDHEAETAAVASSRINP